MVTVYSRGSQFAITTTLLFGIVKLMLGWAWFEIVISEDVQLTKSYPALVPAERFTVAPST